MLLVASCIYVEFKYYNMMKSVHILIATGHCMVLFKTMQLLFFLSSNIFVSKIELA